VGGRLYHCRLGSLGAGFEFVALLLELVIVGQALVVGWAGLAADLLLLADAFVHALLGHHTAGGQRQQHQGK
jgi:hypothetical protein